MDELSVRRMEKEVQKRVDNFGYLKILLLGPETDTSKFESVPEGVWATFDTSADRAIYLNERREGEKFKAILCNQPVGWPHRWGDEITATNNGNERAFADPQDNGISMR